METVIKGMRKESISADGEDSSNKGYRKRSWDLRNAEK